MKSFRLLLLLCPLLLGPVYGSEFCFVYERPPLLSIGGGYWHAGPRHSDGLFQLEYKFGEIFFRYLRPQVSLVAPEMRALFLGVGLAFEIVFRDHWVFSPNFEPGFYWRGSGRNLGYPLEFRSALELAYEWDNACRFGGQLYHISNASLSNRNPGANALTLFFALPLPRSFP